MSESMDRFMCIYIYMYICLHLHNVFVLGEFVRHSCSHGDDQTQCALLAPLFGEVKS